MGYCFWAGSRRCGGPGQLVYSSGPLSHLLGVLMTIVTRSIAILLWLAPLVWFGSQHEWIRLAVWVPITAIIVVLAVRKTRKRSKMIAT